MPTLYEKLKAKYKLTQSYKKLSPEEETKLIKEWQKSSTPQYRKNEILEEFWNINKNRIVKQAIVIYSTLKKQYNGDISLEIDDLISKGASAISHCLQIWDAKKKVRFGTLLQWWIRPKIMQRIAQENFIIYVPHYSKNKKPNVTITSADQKVYDTSILTKIDTVKSDNPTPEELAKVENFWATIKSNLTPEEYSFLSDWVFLQHRFENKTEFCKKYKIKPDLVNIKLKPIYNKLKAILKDWYI